MSKTIIPLADLMQVVANANDEAGGEGFGLRTDYSGRGMFGETCIGFDIDRYAPDGLLAVALVEVLGDLGKTLLRSKSGDSMGMGSIVYFPGFGTDGKVCDNDGEVADPASALGYCTACEAEYQADWADEDEDEDVPV